MNSTKNRPYVIINCAMSLDGKIASPSGKQIKISSDEDIKRMYQLRNECDAVLVGINTVLSDDPKLTVKEKYVPNPQQPIRVILDSTCKTPKQALILNNKAQTIIITAKGNEQPPIENHIEIIGCKTDNDGHINIEAMLQILAEKNIKKVLVEGGGTVIWSFIQHKCVDDMFVYIGSMIIGGKNTPKIIMDNAIDNKHEVIPLNLIKTKKMGEGILLHYRLIP